MMSARPGVTSTRAAVSSTESLPVNFTVTSLSGPGLGMPSTLVDAVASSGASIISRDAGAAEVAGWRLAELRMMVKPWSAVTFNETGITR